MFHVTTFEPRVLSWWRSQRNRIDFDPSYQRRGRLWSRSDKAFLIDTILNDFDVPKIYIADFIFGQSPLNRKKLPYAIIDGKQRLEAIFDFYDGMLVLDSQFEYKVDPSQVLAGLGYADLKNSYPEIADKFDNFHLSVMRVVSSDEKPINDLFVRLNRNKPLTGAEIRNAMEGPAPAVYRRIAKHELFTDFVKFNVQRGQDLNVAAKLVLFEYLGEFHDTAKKDLDGFVKTTKSAAVGTLELAGRRVLDTLDEMARIFLPHDELLSSGGVLPVYYWLIRNLIDDEKKYFREFLISFEAERKTNRDTLRAGNNAAVDRKLIEFDQFSRNSNHRASYTGRVEILQIRFKSFQTKRLSQKRAKQVVGDRRKKASS